METGLFKRLPYGNSDFRDIIMQNYVYIDKTRFIEEPENESNRNHFFIRSMSEYETVSGRADIFLQRNLLYPQIRYEWIFEIKYSKASAKDSEIEDKRNAGLEQLTEYLSSNRMKNRSNLKVAPIVFTGKNRFEITEIK